jgi:hypothetical protein
MALITYPNKNTGDPFTAAEATEIKSVVNANYTEVSGAIEDAVNDALDSEGIPAALALKAPIESPTFTGTVSGITKSMVGLGNVDNTSDASKPVSTAQATAIAVVQSDVNAHEALTNNPHSVTKTQVGLPNVDNTADTAKPVSTAQQTALNLKANLASPTFTGTVSGITKSMVGLGSVDNTADTAKPVSTAQQTAIDAKVADAINNGTTTIAPSQNAVFDALALKAPLASPTFTGTPAAPTATAGTNTTQLATTAFVTTAISTSTSSEIYNIGLTAVGDGVTDDRAAIQNAYDTAYTAGYRLFYLPKGTYLMSLSTGVGIYGCLFIKPGTTLFGDGDDTVIKRHSSHLLGVTITYDKTSHNAAALADRNYHLSKFKILGTTGRGYESPIGSSETEGGIFLATATNRSNKVVIEHVRCESLNKESIAVWDVVEATIRWNRVYDCNFDAYNPQLCDSLILTGNYAHGCNIGCEYEGKRTGGIPTHALISNNEFVNIYEYGIGVEAGDNVKITGNLLVGQTGSTTETFQAIGVYILPNQGNIDTLEISGNQIINFIQAGVSNSVPNTSDYVITNLIIKGNTCAKNGENCIRLKAYSNAKILHTDISGNTFRDWNRIDNGTSVQWSAIHIEEMDDVSIHNNNSRNVVNGKRNDPLFIKNTTNVRFYNNDVTGPPSEFNSTLDVKQQGTNTSLTIFDNPGLLTTDTRMVEAEVPSGTMNSSNPTFTIANTPVSGLLVFWNGQKLRATVGYTISGTTLTMTNPPDSGDSLEVYYRK